MLSRPDRQQDRLVAGFRRQMLGDVEQHPAKM